VNRRTIHKLEFYITNVCNLTCEGCNRFNNIKFRGTQRWEDFAEDYLKWSTYLDVRQKVILGGEPFLNPTLLQWIEGLHKCWPQIPTQILTNGYYIDKIDGLLDTCRKHKAWIGISKHSDDHLALESRIERYLGGIESKTVDNNTYTYRYRDQTIMMWDQTYFHQNSLIPSDNGYKLYSSDPSKAHAICPHVKSKNYHMSKGKLFKCATVDLLKELDKQHLLGITDEERDLLNQYRPLTLDSYESESDKFFDHLDDVIPQCKFCPEKHIYTKIIANHK
jgi:organic radical activating enzyme